MDLFGTADKEGGDESVNKDVSALRALGWAGYLNKRYPESKVQVRSHFFGNQFSLANADMVTPAGENPYGKGAGSKLSYNRRVDIFVSQVPDALIVEKLRMLEKNVFPDDKSKNQVIESAKRLLKSHQEKEDHKRFLSLLQDYLAGVPEKK